MLKSQCGTVIAIADKHRLGERIRFRFVFHFRDGSIVMK
jgi:hypothetical protein